MIATSLTLTEDRLEAINFLLPIGFETYAVFISRSSSSEELSWTTFSLPFSKMLWIALIINALLLLIFMKVFQWLIHRDKTKKLTVLIADAVSNYWMILCSYLGRKPTSFPTDRRGSSFFQVVTFVVLFCGNVIFMAYRASLTSELSSVRPKLPFTSLEELYQTDYKYAS